MIGYVHQLRRCGAEVDFACLFAVRRAEAEVVADLRTKLREDACFCSGSICKARYAAIADLDVVFVHKSGGSSSTGRITNYSTEITTSSSDDRIISNCGCIAIVDSNQHRFVASSAP